MIMSRFTSSRKGAYVIHLPALVKLWSIIDKRIGEVEIEAECADGVKRTFDSVNDVASYENPIRKQILSMSLEAHSKNFDKRVSIDFSSKFGYTVRLSISSTDEEISLLREDITDVIQGMKHQVLSLIVGRDYFLGFMVLSCLIGVASITTNIAMIGSVLPLGFDARTLAERLLIYFYGTMFLVLLWYIFDKLRVKLMPPIFFTIGQGASRYESWRNQWKAVLGVTLASITIVVGIIVSLVA